MNIGDKVVFIRFQICALSQQEFEKSRMVEAGYIGTITKKRGDRFVDIDNMDETCPFHINALVKI